MTKLAVILAERGMTQKDLKQEILTQYGFEIGKDRISKMVSGKLTNYHVQTAKLVADTLKVKVDDIIE
jgi:DNA-binding Xre family transcriptional regulator